MWYPFPRIGKVLVKARCSIEQAVETRCTQQEAVRPADEGSSTVMYALLAASVALNCLQFVTSRGGAHTAALGEARRRRAERFSHAAPPLAVGAGLPEGAQPGGRVLSVLRDSVLVPWVTDLGGIRC